MDAQLLAGVGPSGRVRCGMVGDHCVLHEKRPEASGTADVCGTNCRAEDRPKGRYVYRIARVCCSACFPRTRSPLRMVVGAPYVSIVGDALVALGWTIIFFVFKENTYTSATIEIAAGQKVVTTGPYAIVRYSMYSGSFLYILGMPIALGSWWGLLVVLLMILLTLWRLFDEENFLKKNLSGYREYTQKVRYRLVPYLW
jgi:protein-S-isoprenylcysteine O-methyltransferase Ste14